jgi:nifR3 family TIM-barrel protein
MNGENGAGIGLSPLGPLPRLGTLALASRYVLAPLAGYTNLAFRMAVRGCGGLGLATTDLVNARALLQGSRKSLELIQTCPDDRPLAVQLYGSEPDYMAAAAQWLQDYGVTVVDINMGCPVQKVVKGGGGSAMMCSSPAQTIKLVQAVVEAVRVPVTVKMRLGWDEQNLSAPFFAREFEQVGVAGVTIHGRTREQGFGGTVHLDGIRTVAEAVERIPVFGNGDVRTVADAARMLEVTGCTGLAIGRGALLNPWFFAQLASWEATGDPGHIPSYAERLDFMERHFHSQVRLKGEWFGCLTFRKVANWYCTVLKPGREVQQRLTMIGSSAEFDEIAAGLRERYLRDGPPPGWRGDATIAVPSGPVSHW